MITLLDFNARKLSWEFYVDGAHLYSRVAVYEYNKTISLNDVLFQRNISIFKINLYLNQNT